MSDSEDYEYEYDESDQEAMCDGGGEEDDEGDSFVYESDEDQPGGGDDDGDDDGEIGLENTYYDAKAERDAGEMDEARETFERVVQMEINRNKKAAGVDVGDGDSGGCDAMEVESPTVASRLTPLKYHGSWSYKAIKQLVKLHLRVPDRQRVMRDYSRMLRVASSPDAAVSPNAMEKGVNGMLDRVSGLVSGFPPGGSVVDENSDPRTLARSVYDLTLDAFHPTKGISPNERLWFKTNLKYGQLLYEMNETSKLQLVIGDLLRSSGQPTDILEGGSGAKNASSNMDAMLDNSSNTNTASTGGTHVMEICALQIQLYSRLKDTKRLRAAYRRAMSVRGGIPHPRTLALIQELGGKMHMSQRNFDEASQSFFQAFKSYDEAGDRSRLRCLKYLVMASMLHASSINPFDSHEARAHRDDPEIVAMTNLVQAFHNNDVRGFERVLQKNEGRLMDDEFVREHVADLLRTIRTQVIMRNIGPYTRIRLSRIAHDLNDIPVEDVEGLLVSLILDGRLEGSIDQVNGILVKRSSRDAGSVEKDGNKAVSSKDFDAVMHGSVEARNLASLMQLTSALENLTCAVAKAGGGKGSPSSFHQQVLQ